MDNIREIEIIDLEEVKPVIESYRMEIMDMSKMFKEPTEIQKLQWRVTALEEALQYLVDTKTRKDTIGKDSLYFERQRMGWMKAKQLLNKEDNG